MSMDKTIRRQCSLTAWVRELLKAFLKSPLTRAHEVGAERKAQGGASVKLWEWSFILLNGMAPAFSICLEAPFCRFDPSFTASNFVSPSDERRAGRRSQVRLNPLPLRFRCIHLLRRLGKYVICFQNLQGLFNYFASDLFVEYEFLRRRRNAA